MVHVHMGENAGNGEGVGYVGLAAAPPLTLVSLFCVVVGAFDQLHLIGRKIALKCRAKRIYTTDIVAAIALLKDTELLHVPFARHCRHADTLA